MPVLLPTCSGSAGDLQLGQRHKRLYLIWDWSSEQSALHEDGHLKKFWLSTAVVLQVVTCVRLLCHADMWCGEIGQHFLPPGLGKKMRWKCLLFCPRKVWEGRPVSNLSPGCDRVPLVHVACLLQSTRSSCASFGRIITLPLTLVEALCRERSVCSNSQMRVENKKWEPLVRPEGWALVRPHLY